MSKREIKKRKRNMESIAEFREEKREMLRSVFWFEKRTIIFAYKTEKYAIFSNFEKRKRNFETKSHDSRGDPDLVISNFS